MKWKQIRWFVLAMLIVLGATNAFMLMGIDATILHLVSWALVLGFIYYRYKFITRK